jgi:hypothetical protein
MIKNKSVFFGVYEVIEKNIKLKNGDIKRIEVDEIPSFIDDKLINICSYLNNKVNTQHIATYIKNKSKININNKYYRIYKFIED